MLGRTIVATSATATADQHQSGAIQAPPPHAMDSNGAMAVGHHWRRRDYGSNLATDDSNMALLGHTSGETHKGGSKSKGPFLT